MILPAFEQVETASLPRVLEALVGADLVTVRRYPRCDSALRRGQSYVFEALLKRVGSKFRDPGCTVQALKRAVLEETQLYGEQHGFLPVLAANVGFKVVEIDLPQARRDAARKVQRPRSYVHRLVDILSVFFLTRFTRRPLRFFGPVGAACMAAGFVGLAIVVVQRLFLGVPLAERPALILSSLFDRARAASARDRAHRRAHRLHPCAVDAPVPCSRDHRGRRATAAAEAGVSDTSRRRRVTYGPRRRPCSRARVLRRGGTVRRRGGQLRSRCPRAAQRA